MYHSRILFCQFFQSFRCSICRMIIYNNNIEIKISLLRKSTINCIRHGTHTISHGNNNRSLILKTSVLRKIYRFNMRGRNISIYIFKIFRKCCFHFFLATVKLRIQIIKLLLPTLSFVFLYRSIKILGYMQNLSFAACP